MSVDIAVSRVSFQQNQLFRRCDMTILDWEINIQNTAASVAAKYGNEVAASVFRRYDATCFEDLSPSHYWDVFGNLQQMDEDFDDDGDG